jgi:SIR2-like domain
VDPQITTVVSAILNGRLVPFLGAGANLCGRPDKESYKQGQYLPSGGELASYLAEYFGYPATEAQEVKCPHCGKMHLAPYPKDLLRVAQYVAVSTGSGPLYDELRRVFDADYPPTALHHLVASIPGILRNLHYPPRYQLVVTTNYDDLLERAFNAAGEPFELVTYVAEGEKRGKFLHRSPDGTERVIESPNTYAELALEKRSVIMKIHGAVDRTNPDQDSFIITEDHYIDYLSRTDISELVPAKLAARLRRSHFLFLGYSLSDWNLRVILHRIWGDQKLTYNSWAIQLEPKELDRKFWQNRGVEIINQGLDFYVAALGEGLQALPQKSGNPP